MVFKENECLVFALLSVATVIMKLFLFKRSRQQHCLHYTYKRIRLIKLFPFYLSIIALTHYTLKETNQKFDVYV